MIEVIDIHKSFGETKVLNGITLTFEKKKVSSIVGASGAGKTTLLQIIGTLTQPHRGTVLIEGQNIHRLRGRRLSRFRSRTLGFVFQFHNLLPEFTAWENVALPAWIAGQNKTEAKQNSQKLLDRMGLSKRQNHFPNQLSGGEQQRVAMARALINKPQVVLADEPSGNLDSLNRKALHDLVFELRDEFQQTFIIVTHEDSFAQQSDAIIRLQDGKLVT